MVYLSTFGNCIQSVSESTLIKIGGNKMLKELFKNSKYRNVITNISAFEKMNKRIKEIDYSFYPEHEFTMECLKIGYEIKSTVITEDIIVKVYALIKEAIYRILGVHPFDVQVIAGIAMYYNNIIEMMTGEGKTLAGVFPICFNALSGNKVDVLTANDYLAKRDCEWMGKIYEYFGLTVGYISETMTRNQRREIYKKDIVYLTVKESGFDYLKNFLCIGSEEYIHRNMDFALIDEADSILIDEARIPLVIAGETNEEMNENPFYLVNFIRNLKETEDFELGDYDTNISLTDQGIDKCERYLDIDNLYSTQNVSYLIDINHALEAEYLFKKDVDYIIRDKTVYQVDSITGRVAENRQWQEGLQKAIEAKEGLIPKVKGRILAQISIEHYIKLYSKVSGMTGTIVSSADEISEKYNLNIVKIPTNKKCIRIDQKDSLYITIEAKNKAVLREINKMYLLKRPILVATSSIEESILLARKLELLNIKCQVLNAKNDEEEAKIVAEAGDLGAVTISTNMAGRGTDIKLGGRDERNRREVMKLGGLYVIATNRHDSLRIDNQLRGRAGRQGDCGESKFFISLEDDMLQKFALYKFIPMELYPVNKEDPIVHKRITRQIDVAQRIAQGNSRRIRKNITNYSMILEMHRLEITEIRNKILIGNKKKEIMKENLPIRYEELSLTIGEGSINKAETQILLYLISRYWSYYLENAAYLRQTINMVNIGHKSPVQEYDMILHRNFHEMMEQIFEEAIRILAEIRMGENGIDMEAEGMGAPTSTLTFLLDDSAEALGIDNIFGMASLFLGPIVIPMMIYKKIMDKKGLKEKNHNILKS